MTPPNVPATKAASELKPGDRIAAGYLPIVEAADVRFVDPYTRQGSDWAFVVCRPGRGLPEGYYFQAAAQIPVEPADDGMTYTRADSEPDDPTPVSPARHPLHTGGPVGTVSDSTLVVDETPEHYETGGSVGPNPGDHGRDCACGVSFNGFDTAAEAQTVLDQHIRGGQS